MITIEVNDELFLDWIYSVKNSFSAMLETMIRVAEEVKDKTQMITPIETGRLSKSFKWTVVEDNSRFKILQVRMSALNPDTGFDYAYVQHRGWHTAKDGRRVYYRRNKFINLGFFNYKKGDKRYEIESDPWLEEFHHGEDRYLKNGIFDAKNTAFEMIETDYLSMFNGSFIL